MSRRGWEQYLSPYARYRIPEHPGYKENSLWTIHVARLLDAETCSWVAQMVEEYTDKHGWGTDRHTWHPTTDVTVSAMPVLDRWMRRLLLTTILPSLADLFGFEARHLITRDVFVVRYCPGAQDRLAPHRDGNLLSFNILLSDPYSFAGGGTYFSALGRAGMQETMAPDPGGSDGDAGGGQTGRGVATEVQTSRIPDGIVRPGNIGDITLHTGKLLHEGVRVTQGTRMILVGFVRVLSPKVNRAYLASRAANQSRGGLEADYKCLARALQPCPPLAAAT
ncbi:unnamed protein product [Discosporangium mesarthrocarpum]